MGNIDTKKQDNANIFVKTETLRDFFARIPDSHKKDRILQEKPIASNYNLEVMNKYKKPRIIKGNKSFSTDQYSLSFHLEFIFDSKCVTIISEKYWKKIKTIINVMLYTRFIDENEYHMFYQMRIDDKNTNESNIFNEANPLVDNSIVFKFERSKTY